MSSYDHEPFDLINVYKNSRLDFEHSFEFQLEKIIFN